MKKQYLLIYLQLVLAACLNIVIYVAWQWALEEVPSFLVLLLFQNVWNIMVAVNITKTMDTIV